MAIKFTPQAESELSKFDNLPDGEYPFTVLESAEVASKSEKNKGRPMVKLKLCVHGKEYDRHVYDYFADWFSEWKLKHFCEAVGLAKDYSIGHVDPSDNQWQNRQGCVRIETENDPKYGKKNVVSDYIPNENQTVEAIQGKPAEIKPEQKTATPQPAQPSGESDDVPF